MWLDILRLAWGAPVMVNSGWRCESHNARVGGSRLSRHLIGCAADIRIGGSRRDWEKFSQLTERLCSQPGWEFRPYETFLHIAVPRLASERPWLGGDIRL